jgi:nitrogen fixation protein
MIGTFGWVHSSLETAGSAVTYANAWRLNLRQQRETMLLWSIISNTADTGVF